MFMQLVDLYFCLLDLVSVLFDLVSVLYFICAFGCNLYKYLAVILYFSFCHITYKYLAAISCCNIHLAAIYTNILLLYYILVSVILHTNILLQYLAAIYIWLQFVHILILISCCSI